MESPEVKRRQVRRNPDRCRAGEARSTRARAWALCAKEGRIPHHDCRDTHHFEARPHHAFQFEDRLIGFNEEEKFRRRVQEPTLPNEEESYTMSYLTKKSACLR